MPAIHFKRSYPLISERISYLKWMDMSCLDVTMEAYFVIDGNRLVFSQFIYLFNVFISNFYNLEIVY